MLCIHARRYMCTSTYMIVYTNKNVHASTHRHALCPPHLFPCTGYTERISEFAFLFATHLKSFECLCCIRGPIEIVVRWRVRWMEENSRLCFLGRSVDYFCGTVDVIVVSHSSAKHLIQSLVGTWTPLINSPSWIQKINHLMFLLKLVWNMLACRSVETMTYSDSRKVDKNRSTSPTSPPSAVLIVRWKSSPAESPTYRAKCGKIVVRNAPIWRRALNKCLRRKCSAEQQSYTWWKNNKWCI